MNLRDCYDEVRRLDSGLEIDSLEVVEEVSRIRQFWKPETVRVVLLAESHVFTATEDSTHPWEIRGTIYRGRFVRFVYCLGYGETSLVQSVTPNRGTSQFWKIFYSCLNQVSSNDNFRSILHSTPAAERISNKIELLSRLKRAGVWLMDASVVGINHMKNLTMRRRVLKKCWNYTHSVLQDLDPKPEHIIVIGCFVKKALKEQIDSLGINWTVIPQPQAHLPAPGYRQFYNIYYQICTRPGMPVSANQLEQLHGCKE